MLRKLACFLGYHNYTDWTFPFKAQERRRVGSFGDTGMFPITIQTRECFNCHIVDSRHVHDGHEDE